MFLEDFNNIATTANKKVQMLKDNTLGYFFLSMLAGIYVGFGILLIFTIGGLLNGAAYSKVLMGASFGIALSLVVIAGAELFTGNNLVMAAGLLQKRITLREALKLWGICYMGNWIGSIVLATLYRLSEAGNGEVGSFIARAAATKMEMGMIPLFFRGILCNILVCLAVWCGFKCKSESGKLIMIFWCLFAFITCGFEHSIANMTLFTAALLNPCGQLVSITGYLYNLFFVTLGNMVGGIFFVALPYFISAKQ